MSWSAACLSLVLASSPAQPQRLNLEPLGFGLAGLVVAGVGAWRLVVADELYARLGMVPSTASSAQEAAALLSSARTLVAAGKLETTAGRALLVIGGAVAVASTLWFLLEGPTTRDWWVSVGPTGVSLAATF